MGHSIHPARTARAKRSCRVSPAVSSERSAAIEERVRLKGPAGDFFPAMRVQGVLPLPGSDRRGLDCVPVPVRERLGGSAVSAGLRSLRHGALVSAGTRVSPNPPSRRRPSGGAAAAGTRFAAQGKPGPQADTPDTPARRRRPGPGRRPHCSSPASARLPAAAVGCRVSRTSGVGQPGHQPRPREWTATRQIGTGLPGRMPGLFPGRPTAPE
jgi:hypothetical protein